MNTEEFIKYLEDKIEEAYHYINPTTNEHVISFKLVDGANVTIEIE